MKCVRAGEIRSAVSESLTPRWQRETKTPSGLHTLDKWLALKSWRTCAVWERLPPDTNIYSQLKVKHTHTHTHTHTHMCTVQCYVTLYIQRISNLRGSDQVAAPQQEFYKPSSRNLCFLNPTMPQGRRRLWGRRRVQRNCFTLLTYICSSCSHTHTHTHWAHGVSVS